MSGIEISASRPRQTKGATSRPSLWSRQTVLNNNLARVLAAILFIVPIPLGSNRPVFWALSAIMLGLAGLYYMQGLGRLGEPFRYGLRHLWFSAILFLLLLAYLVIQVIPLQVLGGGIEPLLALLRIVTSHGSAIEPSAISLAPGATLLSLVQFATYGLLYFLVLQIGTNHQRKEFMLSAMLAIITLHAMLGLASLIQFGDTILGLPKTAYLGSATGTFVNRNSFATFLAFGAIIAVTMAAAKLTEPQEEGTRRRFDPIILIYLVALAIIMSALIATESRMGLFAGVLGCFSVVLLATFRAGNVQARMLALLPVLALGLGVGFYVYGQGLVERLGSVESAADVRLELYDQVVAMIAARPWLGYGGGAFEVAYPLFHSFPVSVDLVWDRAHNTYLALWAELGLVVGSIPILLVLIAMVRIIWGLQPSRPDWSARVAAFGVIIAGAVHSLVDFSLEIQAVAMFFVAIVAIGVSGIARSSLAK